MEALSIALWLDLAAKAPGPLPAVLPEKPPARPVLHWPDANEPKPVAEEKSFSFLDFRATPRSVQPYDPVAYKVDGDKYKRKVRLDAAWVSVGGELTFRDPDLVRRDPTQQGASWATDETLNVPVSDGIFVFGAVDAASESVDKQRLRWLGRTGVGVKLRPWLLNEVQLRGGPGMQYDDSASVPERSQMFVEVTTKLPLPVLGLINVEYTGVALPSIVATERDRLNQNLKFAVPLSDVGSQFHFGARLNSEDGIPSTPWVDRAQLYFGLQLKR